MPQNTLHYNFILNFIKQIICQSWVKYLFYRNWRTIQLSNMNGRKTSLPYFISDFNVIDCDFSNPWNWRQPSWIDRNIWWGMSKGLKVHFLYFIVEIIDLVLKLIFFFSLFLQFFLNFLYSCILSTSCHRSLRHGWSWSSSSSSSPKRLHPIPVIVCYHWSLLFWRLILFIFFFKLPVL